MNGQAPAITTTVTSAQGGPNSSAWAGAVGLWALFGLTIRQNLHGKRWMVVGALFLLPAVLALLLRCARTNIPSGALEFILVFMFIPQAILPLVALLYGSGMIQDELEEQTITYLLIRPLPKWALYVVKLLATVATVVFLTAVFTGITYCVIYVGASAPAENIPLRCVTAMGIHSLAMIAYCSLFGLLSLLTKRSLVVGILYIVVVEGVLANLPFGIRLMTVIYYTRLIAFRLLPFTYPTPHRMENIAADAWQFNIAADPNLLEHPQIATCVVVLLVSSVVFAAMAALIFASREFRVKTPDNG
jgi:ABC-2 type transport system permease protein